METILHDIVHNGMSTKLVSRKSWEGRAIRAITLNEPGYEEFRGLKMRALKGGKKGLAVCIGPVEGKLWQKLEDDGTWDKVTSDVDDLEQSNGALVWVNVVVHINGTRDIINYGVWAFDETPTPSEDEENKDEDHTNPKKRAAEDTDESKDGKKQATIKSYFKNK